MYQKPFLPGLRHGPRWGSLRRSPDRLVGRGVGHPLPLLDAFVASVLAYHF